MGAWLSSTLQKIRFLNPTQQETFQNLGYVSAIIENIQDLLLNPPCYVHTKSWKLLPKIIRRRKITIKQNTLPVLFSVGFKLIKVLSEGKRNPNLLLDQLNFLFQNTMVFDKNVENSNSIICPSISKYLRDKRQASALQALLGQAKKYKNLQKGTKIGKAFTNGHELQNIVKYWLKSELHNYLRVNGQINVQAQEINGEYIQYLRQRSTQNGHYNGSSLKMFPNFNFIEFGKDIYILYKKRPLQVLKSDLEVSIRQEIPREIQREAELASFLQIENDRESTIPTWGDISSINIQNEVEIDSKIDESDTVIDSQIRAHDFEDLIINTLYNFTHESTVELSNFPVDVLPPSILSENLEEFKEENPINTEPSFIYSSDNEEENTFPTLDISSITNLSQTEIDVQIDQSETFTNEYLQPQIFEYDIIDKFIFTQESNVNALGPTILDEISEEQPEEERSIISESEEGEEGNLNE